MTLPASGPISLSTFSVEMGQASTFSNSMSWINARAKVTSNAISGHYGKSWYQQTTAGNCNNGNCTNNCNCGSIQCVNCFISGTVNCANCDTQAYLQSGTNCACTYNCTFSTTATYNCNCDCNCGGTCFLKGSLVHMGDGTLKPIEDIMPGELVLGVGGEINKVIGIDRPYLAERRIVVINGIHATTPEHTHFRQDRTLCVVSVEEYMHERGMIVPVMTEEGNVELWKLPSLPAGLTAEEFTSEMKLGDRLATPDGKGVVIESMVDASYPANTLLYNLITDGSHTFFVNGFGVGGIVNANDFDYKTWAPVGRPWSNADYRDSKTCPSCRKPPAPLLGKIAA